MNLETLAKIGIVFAIITMIIVSGNITLITLKHELGWNFEQLITVSEEQKNKIKQKMYQTPEFIAFEERYPDFQSKEFVEHDQIRLMISKYDPTTQNGLILTLSKHSEQNQIYVDARCDIFSGKSEIRRNAESGFTLDYIKTTACLNH